MINYNPNILQKAADRIYLFSVIYTIFFTLLGGVIGYIIVIISQRADIKSELIIVFAALGLVVGWTLTFWLRVKAQLILCEKNKKSI